ncbi:16S rRNA (uracil(1498)-N(3))-methyltransferase [Urechidicola croceus]|uniref:Ribosomal RNA small subunit methyltransferase E n=1 Tax=Urechidicola croceus TaxID=1850246 RepID=A0A1D8PBI4_9FLAO|nr:16S rRNA (uracil(1498)-N(3))-methyltransferase [Urechidicola croceus]AOW21926.1 16S rRNA (uracil(1498)-N(3))-methyltransferase [Urechidicola croceus]
MQLFYNPHINSDAEQFTFDKIESRHIVKVLRKKEGNTLQITNGKGELFTAELIFANDKKCAVKIISVENKPKPWNYYLHVVIAPTKNIDRFEWFLEKSTEIGIDEITPIICKHSERKIIKEERLEKVIISAMKQSLKYQLPKLNAQTSFKDFINQDLEGDLFIAHCEETYKKSLKKELKPKHKIIVLIGPEGDFSTQEIELALQHKFIPVSLGESRLRTETAGVVATQSVAFFNE